MGMKPRIEISHVKRAHNRTFHKIDNIGVLFSLRKEEIKLYLDSNREEDQFSHDVALRRDNHGYAC